MADGVGGSSGRQNTHYLIRQVTRRLPRFFVAASLFPITTPRRERSPSYPAIPLAAAVERAKEIYRQEKSYPAPIDTILHHWGYSPRSGSGMVAVAALLKFGLLEDEGSGSTRRAKITELGQRIVRDARDVSPDRDHLLRDAALLPQIHRELWEKYRGSLPSDANLQHTLKFEYGFTDLGASEFIREFRATISYARLEQGADVEAPDPADYPTEVEHLVPTSRNWMQVGAQNLGQMPPATVTAGMMLRLPIAGSGPDRWPTLHLPDRLSESDWNLMLVVLGAMKPGIVLSQGTGHASGVGQAFDATAEATSAPDERNSEATASEPDR